MPDIIPPCEVVRVDCTDVQSMGFSIVEPGTEVGVCKVVFTRPSPCVVIPYYTLVEQAKIAKLEVEERGNNVVLYYSRGGEEKMLVYPKHVWESVSKYVDRLAKGVAPPEPGMLLYGPPGTGKTAMLELLADTMGLHIERLEQANVLSKYVGESERNLAELLDRAEEREPSIVIADEGEWILAGRSWSGDVIGPIGHNLVTELLRRLQKWKNMKLAILLAVATNFSIKAVDKAFLRAGRFGKPILVPLPDLEAVRIVFEYYGVYEKLGKEKAERIARRLVAMGANMSDVVEYAKRVVKGEKPRLSTIKGHGYTRVTPIDMPDEEWLRSKLEEAISCERCGEDKSPASRGRYRLIAPLFVGTAVASFWLLMHGYNPILVYDSYRLQEAIHLAEISRAGLIIPVQLIHESELRAVIDANCPVVLVTPSATFSLLSTATINLSDGRAVAELALKFYGIEARIPRLPRIEDVEETIAARLQQIEE